MFIHYKTDIQACQTSCHLPMNYYLYYAFVLQSHLKNSNTLIWLSVTIGALDLDLRYSFLSNNFSLLELEPKELNIILLLK